MSFYKRGAAKSPAVFLLVGAVAFIVLGVIAIVGVKTLLMDRVENKRKEEASLNQMKDNVLRASEGGQLGQRPDFPDTTVGRLSAIAYDYLDEVMKNETWFAAEIEKIDWEWVMTADSLKNGTTVQKSLEITAKAKELAKKYGQNMDDASGAVLAKMKAEAGTDSKGQGFVRGFESSLTDPNKGLSIAKQIVATLLENMEAIEQALTVLKPHSGKYTVAPDGGITFTGNISQKEIDRYNDAIGKIQTTYEELSSLETKRQLAVKQGQMMLKSP